MVKINCYIRFLMLCLLFWSVVPLTEPRFLEAQYRSFKQDEYCAMAAGVRSDTRKVDFYPVYGYTSSDLAFKVAGDSLFRLKPIVPDSVKVLASQPNGAIALAVFDHPSGYETYSMRAGTSVLNAAQNALTQIRTCNFQHGIRVYWVNCGNAVQTTLNDVTRDRSLMSAVRLMKIKVSDLKSNRISGYFDLVPHVSGDDSTGYSGQNQGSSYDYGGLEGYWVRYKATVGFNNQWEWKPDGNVIYMKRKYGQVYEGKHEELNQAQRSAGIRVGDVELWFDYAEPLLLSDADRRKYGANVFKGALTWDNNRSYPNRFYVYIREGRKVFENLTYSIFPQARYMWVRR